MRALHKESGGCVGSWKTRCVETRGSDFGRKGFVIVNPRGFGDVFT